jgi:NaMN:DMB phosphoribosyltransferase
MEEMRSNIMVAGRDFMQEMRHLVDVACVGTWSAPGVASAIVTRLRERDPELLAGFLDLCAVAMVTRLINDRDQSTRSYNRKTASRSVFEKAARLHEEGDLEPLEKLTHFLQELYVSPDGNKMYLKDMRATELNFAADDFAVRAKRNAMQEAFLRVLAKGCGDQAVGDVFTEQQVADLWLAVS